MKVCRPSWIALVALSLALPMTSACGDDESAGAKPPKKRGRRKAKSRSKRKKKSKATGPALKAYPKIDEQWRKKLTDMDFVSDASGDANRDPFRSWILSNSLVDESEGTSDNIEDLCTSKNVSWRAASYSVRDLELSAIIKRGRSNALFVDKSKKDIFILRKGDCVGQEKAVVEEIGVKYVRLSMTPEAAPGAEPIKKDIALHPKELEAASEDAP